MIFSSRQNMKEYFSGDPIGRGSEGLIYKVGNDKVAKIFHESLKLNPFNYHDLLRFKGIDVKNFIFINDLIYYPFRIGGALMPYVPGKILADWELYNVPIDTLIASLTELVASIKALSYEGIKVGWDVSLINTIYDGSSFYFIDTTDYEREDAYSKDIYYYNRREILLMIYCSILNIDSVYDFIQRTYRYDTLYNSELLMEDPKVILTEIKESLEKYLGKDLNSFGEATQYMGR